VLRLAVGWICVMRHGVEWKWYEMNRAEKEGLVEVDEFRSSV